MAISRLLNLVHASLAAYITVTVTIFFFFNDFILVTINICKTINQGFYSFVAFLLHSVVNFEPRELFSDLEILFQVEKNFLNGKLKAITAYFKDVSL